MSEEICGNNRKECLRKSMKACVTDMRSGSEAGLKAPLSRHGRLFHGGREVDFGVRVLSNAYGKPGRRLISESVYINELEDDETMNSRNEWSYVELNRVNVT